jgi:hypothetical protein
MSDPAGWDLFIARDDHSRTDLRRRGVLELGAGEALLRVDRVGVTANNVTYALLGEAMRYWDFFPAPERWGRVPLWGFADVAASEVPGIEVGARLYGYLPTSSDFIVRPERIDEMGFRDASEHRSTLPGPYNIYAATTGDPSYEREREDLQILYRPLFITSFMLDDFIADSDLFGADRILFSSASSKTAYGTAFCIQLRDHHPRLIALTSPGNVSFTESLGCYDEVLSYDDVESMPADGRTAYLDFAGSTSLRQSLHERLRDHLIHDAIVGATHLEGLSSGAGELPGPKPQFFFAPDQIRKRRTDWGPQGIEKRYGVAWRAFAPVVEKWVEVNEGKGPEGLQAAWLEVLSGDSDPRTGHVIQL